MLITAGTCRGRAPSASCAIAMRTASVGGVAAADSIARRAPPPEAAAAVADTMETEVKRYEASLSKALGHPVRLG